jgi:integrase
MHRLKRPDGRPYFRCQIGGKQCYLGTDYKTAAKKFSALVAGLPHGHTRPASLVAAIQRFTTARPDRWHEWALKPVAEFSPDVLLADVDVEWLRRYAASLAERYKPKTAIHYVNAVRACLAWCKVKGWIASVPDRPKMRRPVRNPRDIPFSALAAMLERVPPANRPILQFIVATGCRPGEARSLTWDQVDLERRTCILRSHKTAGATGLPRTIYLTPAALEVLRGLDDHSNLVPAWVFPCRKGTPYSASGLRSIIRRAGGKAVYPLRHTFAQNALETPGVRLEDVAKLLGHSGLETVQMYAQVRNQRALEVAAGLGTAVRSPSPADPAATAAGSASPTPQKTPPAKRKKRGRSAGHHKGKATRGRRSVRT